MASGWRTRRSRQSTPVSRAPAPGSSTTRCTIGGPYGSQDLKQWGFWNSLGGQDGYPASDLQLRPWYYTWSVLARSFPAGSQPLVTPSSGISGLRVAAAKIPSAGGYALSFAVVNDSDASQSITLSVPSATGRLTLARYDYFDGERPTNADGFPVPAQILPNVRLARWPARPASLARSRGAELARPRPLGRVERRHEHAGRRPRQLGQDLVAAAPA